MRTVKSWNMTRRRFSVIVQEELSGNIKNSFVRMFGETDDVIEYSLNSFFNERDWMTKDEKITTLRLMTRVFQEVPLSARYSNQVFPISACLRTPGAFEVWQRASEKAKTSSSIFRYTFMQYPRAVYAYLQLLEKVDFRDFFIVKAFLNADVYVEKTRQFAAGSGLDLHWDNPTPAVMNYLKFGSIRLFTNFGLLENHIIALMHLIYGSEKLEAVLHEFQQSGVEMQPDTIVTVLDKWDDLEGLPAHWIVSCLESD